MQNATANHNKSYSFPMKQWEGILGVLAIGPATDVGQRRSVRQFFGASKQWRRGLLRKTITSMRDLASPVVAFVHERRWPSSPITWFLIEELYAAFMRSAKDNGNSKKSKQTFGSSSPR